MCGVRSAAKTCTTGPRRMRWPALWCIFWPRYARGHVHSAGLAQRQPSARMRERSRTNGKYWGAEPQSSGYRARRAWAWSQVDANQARVRLGLQATIANCRTFWGDIWTRAIALQSLEYIAPAAPPSVPIPRFRASALFGRRPLLRVDRPSFRRPKTCTMHNAGSAKTSRPRSRTRK